MVVEKVVDSRYPYDTDLANANIGIGDLMQSVAVRNFQLMQKMAADITDGDLCFTDGDQFFTDVDRCQPENPVLPTH